jgi:hypothetical protein
MTADRDDAACTGAVVRKPPMKETALGEGVAVPRALIYRGLTLAAAVICEHNFCVMARTLLTVENSFCVMCNFEELRGVAYGKNSAYFNFCVRCLIAVPHRAPIFPSY